LLQNADDARYDITVEPCIKFRVTQTELIIDINEQGFTLQNVRALCDTGKSSKVNDGTTTGEKGLGFKSVFTIANVVKIQSGFWSFRFENFTEDGIGMVTPLWTTINDSTSKHKGTRMRLQYSDPKEPFLRELVSHFEGLPKTILYALRQIVRLEAVVEDVSSRSGAVCFHRTYGNDPSRLQQIQSTVTGTFGTHHSHTAYFRSFQETATNLPGHKLRSSDRSSVSVALEYDGIEKPVIPKEGQHVFAFLPVQQIRQLPVSPARHFNVLWLTITVPPSRGLCPDRKS
jgi:hypothetical protein